VRILVKDTVAAKNGYGPYVEPVSVDINSQGALVWLTRHIQHACVLAVGIAIAHGCDEQHVQWLSGVLSSLQQNTFRRWGHYLLVCCPSACAAAAAAVCLQVALHERCKG
jgi:hypothetical protein